MRSVLVQTVRTKTDVVRQASAIWLHEQYLKAMQGFIRKYSLFYPQRANLCCFCCMSGNVITSMVSGVGRVLL